jgi:hypothetical protein
MVEIVIERMIADAPDAPRSAGRVDPNFRC